LKLKSCAATCAARTGALPRKAFLAEIAARANKRFNTLEACGAGGFRILKEMRSAFL